MILNLKLLSFTVLLVFVSALPGRKIKAACSISAYDEVSAAIARCTTLEIHDMVVPGGKALDLNLKDGTALTFKGTIKFDHAVWTGPLVKVTGNNLTVQGAEGSLLDGQGPLYWDGKGGSGTTKPVFFNIEATKSSFTNIKLLNCPERCTSIQSTDITLSGWLIDCSAGDEGVAAPGKEGHNTDGFDISSSTQIIIKDSIVKNQDDCIAINKGTGMHFSGLHCSGCHGLSLSVGLSKISEADNTVKDILFSDSVVVNSGTAIHIKTHSDGGPGIVSNVTYRNITFEGISDYGINVQQNYGNSNGPPSNNIPITGLNLINVKGSVSGSNSRPVYIFCGNNSCSDWNWSEVKVSGGHYNTSCNFTPPGFQC